MQELEKPYFIRKNKLVRTTTFTMALLIATTLLISSVVPAAIQVNNTSEIKTKANDMQQSNPQAAIDLRSIDRTINTYPSKMSKINNGGNDNLMDLWDNGLPDGVNGLSCMLWSSYNRELCDDFVADVPWIVDGGSFRIVTYYGYGPEAITAVNIIFYEDNGGVPSTNVIATYTDSTPTGTLTGDYYFGRPEILVEVDYGPQILNPGTYWIVFQSVSTDNIFWLTSTGYGSQVYVSYPDLGYPKWTPGYTLWYAYYYGVSFKLTGNIAGIEHDVSVNSITAPVSGAAGASFTPKIKVGNNGNQTENNVPVHMTIGHWVPEIPAVYYMNENFNSWMPAGWTQEAYEWQQYWSNYAGGTYPEACLPYYYVSGNLAWLMSPAVNTLAATTLHLSFRSFIDWYFDADIYCKVLVQSGSGDWSDVTPWANPVTGNVGPGLYDINIISKKGSGTQVKFEFSGNSYDLDYWYIDDVQFLKPGVPGYYETEYTQTLTVNIPQGSMELTFPNWAPQGWHTKENQDINYQIKAWTELPSDEIPSNDLKTKTITLSYPFFHDIEVTSINAPVEDGPAKTLPVACTIKNVGQYQECCYQTSMVIGQQLVVGTAMTQDFSSGLMPPTGWTDEHKLYYYYYGWYISYSQQSGGTSPEAYLPYYYALAGYKLYSNAFDTSGFAGAVFEFKSYINHYYGQGLYTLKAAASTNYGPWVEVWSFAPSQSQQFEVSVPIPSGINTRVALYFEGDPWYFNYWYVDDIIVKGVEVVEEYSEAFCTIELDPGEEADLEYSDWTPADLALGVSGEIDYIVVAEQLLPTDTNPTNDKLSDGFTLSYWHDVKVKEITSPSMGRGDVIFSQRPYTPTESWSFYTSDIGPGYLCQEDFWDLTDTIGDVHWYGLPLIYAYGWQQGNPNGMQFEIKFYEDSGGVPGAVVATFSDLEPTGINTGISYSGFIMYYWEVDLPSSVGLANGWISIQSTYCPDGSWLLWAGGPEGNNNAMQNGGSLFDNLAFNLTKGGPPGPVKPEVWVPLNADESIAGIVQNLGTFIENDLTCYEEIWEYITDPENGTLAYSDYIDNIDLINPLGGEETVIFDNYVFAMQGVYNVILNIPLSPPELDDKPGNNLMKLGVGCDNTKPVTTHTLNPTTPNGLNGWYVSDLTVTLDAKDGTEVWQSGVKEIAYKIGDGPIKTIPGGHGSFKVEDDGEDIPVKYWAIDKVGNTEAEHTFTVDMDQTKPTISMTYEVTGGSPLTGYDFTFTVTATDEMSGMERVEFYLNNMLQETVTGPGPTYQWVVDLGNIPNLVVKAIGYDIAGNNAFDEIENPHPHSNEQSLPNSQTTVKINLGR